MKPAPPVTTTRRPFHEVLIARDIIGAVPGPSQGLTLLHRRAILREEPSLLSYAVRLLGHEQDARECVQDALVKACEAGAAPDQWRPWFFRLTHNAAVDRLRRKGAEGRALRVVGRRPTGVRDVSPGLLEEMLAGLPTEPRAIPLLRFAHGLAFSEIADILGVRGKLLYRRGRRL